MNQIRTKLNQAARIALELGLTKTDLYGIGETTGLQTWSVKYFKYSRSAAIMHIMIERTINAVSAINSTTEGLELMRIFLEHRGLVGEAVATHIRYIALFNDGTRSEPLRLSDTLELVIGVTGIKITEIPNLDQVVARVCEVLSAKMWTNQSMASLLSIYSEYCRNMATLDPRSTLGAVVEIHDVTGMLKLAVINAATACNKMAPDRPLFARYMAFINTLTNYGWLVTPTNTDYYGVCIRHNVTNPAPPLDWTIYPADIEHSTEAVIKGGW